MIVLDTDSASEYVKRSVRGVFVDGVIRGQSAVVPFAVVAELERWQLSAGLGTRRREEIARFLDGAFIVYPDRNTCLIWGDIVHSTAKIGRRLTENDAWIAAMALQLDLPFLPLTAAILSQCPTSN